MEDGLASSPGASSDSPKEVGNLNRPVLEGEEGIPRLKKAYWGGLGEGGGGWGGGGGNRICM